MHLIFRIDTCHVRPCLCSLLATALPRLKDDWHMHHHGSRYPHSWASDKNRVEEYWQECEPQQAQFRKRLYEREGQVRQMLTIAAILHMRATTLTNVLRLIKGVFQAWDSAAVSCRYLA